MAIDANTLMEEAKCYLCLGISISEALELALLARIAEGGGGGGGDIIQAYPNFTLAANTNEQTVYSVNIPGGSMTANGAIRLYMLWEATPGALGTRTLRAYYGGSIFAQVGMTQSLAIASILRVLLSSGSDSSQISEGPSTILPPFTLNINSAVDQTLHITGQLTGAADTLTLKSVLIETLSQ